MPFTAYVSIYSAALLELRPLRVNGARLEFGRHFQSTKFLSSAALDSIFAAIG